MPILESATGKAFGVAARFLPQLTSHVEAAVIADHRPISASPNFWGNGSRFKMWIVVAPNRSPRYLEPLEFTERAAELAQVVFDGASFQTQHSGSEQCRYFIPNPTHATSLAAAIHILDIHPDGRILLQWGLGTTQISGSRDVEISLDEIVTVAGHMHRIARSPVYASLVKRRRLSGIRKLDWRIGVIPSITGDDHNVVYWRSITASTLLPAITPTDQTPTCPSQGYATRKMMSVSVRVPASKLFAPALEQFFVDAGYASGVRESVAAALERIDGRAIGPFLNALPA